MLSLLSCLSKLSCTIICMFIQAPLSYDQSQVGMLSISFLDATNHPTNSSHAHSFIPSHDYDSQPNVLPATSTTQTSNVATSSLDHSLLPLNIYNLPALQGIYIPNVIILMYMYISMHAYFT